MKYKRFILLIVLLQAVHGVCGAQEYDRYFQDSAREVNVPVYLTKAIARVESKNHPYALNVEGKSFFYANKEAAIQAAYQAEAAGQSYDSGIMQINNWWLKRYDIPIEAVWEPQANILLGSWILRQAMNGSRDVWAGVGRYHSPSADRGARYAQLVRQAVAGKPVLRGTAKKAVKTKSSQRVVAQQTVVPSPTLSAKMVIYRQQQVFHREPPPPKAEKAKAETVQQEVVTAKTESVVAEEPRQAVVQPRKALVDSAAFVLRVNNSE